MSHIYRNLSLTIIILLFCFVLVSAQDGVRLLEPDRPIEQELTGGKGHAYRIPLAAGQFVDVIADQRGIDVVLVLFAPNGKQLLEVDSPNGTHGPEQLSFLTETAGDYKIEVRSLEKNAAPGRYEIKINELRPATPRDIALFKGRAALAEGKALRAKGTPESYQQAIEKLKSAVGFFREAGDQNGEANSLSSLGLAYQNLLQLDAALEFERKSLEIFERTSDKRSSALVTIFIAQIFRAMGDYTKAINSYLNSYQLYSEIGDKRRMYGNIDEVGIMYQYQGNYVEAYKYLHEGLTTANELQAPGLIGSSLINIGALFFTQGDDELALEYHQKALDLFEKSGRVGGAAVALANIGEVYLRRHESSKALEYFKRSLKFSEEMNRKEAIAMSLESIGSAYEQQGNIDLALEYMRKSLALRNEELSNIGSNQSRSDFTGLLIMISDLYRQKRDFGQALQYAEQAVNLLRRAGHRDALWDALTQLGKLYEETGKGDKAQETFKEAIDSIEDLRSNVVGGEQQEQTFFSNKVAPYTEMIRLKIASGNAEDAFNLAERTKSRVLVDLLAGGRVNLTQAMTPEEIGRERQLKNELVVLNGQISSAGQTVQLPTSTPESLAGRLEEKRRELERFKIDLYAAHPELRIKRGELKPISVEEAGLLIPNEESTLLEYAVADDKAFLFALTRSGKSQVSLKGYPINIKEKELAEKVESLRSKLAKGDLDFQKLGRELYDLLLKPAEAQLAGKTNLIIVPDGPLWNLPFQALQDGQNQYLIEKAAVSYAPSLTALREMSKKGRSRKASQGAELVAFGNPSVGKETADRIKPVFMDETLEPLPEAERLVNSLAKIYGADRSKVFTGPNAREDIAKAEAPKYRIVQFATHGILNNVSPMYSHLVLSRAAGDTKEDGLLEAWEVMDLNLNADVVVLAACETARGRLGAGEGMIGMSWAFFVAGAPTTVASQWKVESASTTQLMLEFHRNLKARIQNPSGQISKARALQLASLKLLKSREYQHPFYWGGFVVIGDGF